MAQPKFPLLLLLALLIFPSLASPAAAFGAGNIASISRIEGKNWRHGDIEDVLKTIAFIKGKKWTTMMIKRVYFGNWLRDYSQAMDVATLSKVQCTTIRILVWILAFMSFGYATGEFEVTEERLGVYRPEEHIDNPKDYADNQDARKYDPRLRPLVNDLELAIDPETGMKNYIAKESGGWATSSGYVKHSFARSIHFGRVYRSGARGTRGKEGDLCEALRCLGQALHTLEDFGAHTNYTELTLRELGFRNVFTHTGTATEIIVRGKQMYPLVTGTFGGVDFLHSVIGEATDHITQSEVDEMDITLGEAQEANKRGVGGSSLGGLCNMLSKVPGTGDLVLEAQSLQTVSDAQASANEGIRGFEDSDVYASTRASNSAIPGFSSGANNPQAMLQNMQNLDPEAVIKKIYPILSFRDKVVRAINTIIAKIPGLEYLIETITERVTLFVLSLLAPFIRPIIQAATASLKVGSSGVVQASGRHQYEPWTDPICTDPTHSLLSKDHFSNILNEPAGNVAAEILKYVAPRILYAWQHPDVPVDQILNDVVRVFHHPALRDNNLEIHRNMFAAVEQWVQRLPDKGASLNDILSSESVKAGNNHQGGQTDAPHSHGSLNLSAIPGIQGLGSHSKVSGSAFEIFTKRRKMTPAAEAPQGIEANSSWWTTELGYSGQTAPEQQYPSSSEQQPTSQQAWIDQQPLSQSHEYAHEVPGSYEQGYSDEYPTQVAQPLPGPGAYGGLDTYQEPPYQEYYPTQGPGQTYHGSEWQQGPYGGGYSGY